MPLTPEEIARALSRGNQAFQQSNPEDEGSWLDAVGRVLEPLGRPVSTIMSVPTSLARGESVGDNAAAAWSGEKYFGTYDLATALGAPEDSYITKGASLIGDFLNPADPLNYLGVGFIRKGAKGAEALEKLGKTGNILREAELGLNRVDAAREGLYGLKYSIPGTGIDIPLAPTSLNVGAAKAIQGSSDYVKGTAAYQKFRSMFGPLDAREYSDAKGFDRDRNLLANEATQAIADKTTAMIDELDLSDEQREIAMALKEQPWRLEQFMSGEPVSMTIPRNFKAQDAVALREKLKPGFDLAKGYADAYKGAALGNIETLGKRIEEWKPRVYEVKKVSDLLTEMGVDRIGYPTDPKAFLDDILANPATAEGIVKSLGPDYTFDTVVPKRMVKSDPLDTYKNWIKSMSEQPHAEYKQTWGWKNADQLLEDGDAYVVVGRNALPNETGVAGGPTPDLEKVAGKRTLAKRKATLQKVMPVIESFVYQGGQLNDIDRLMGHVKAAKLVGVEKDVVEDIAKAIHARIASGRTATPGFNPEARAQYYELNMFDNPVERWKFEQNYLGEKIARIEEEKARLLNPQGIIADPMEVEARLQTLHDEVNKLTVKKSLTDITDEEKRILAIRDFDAKSRPQADMDVDAGLDDWRATFKNNIRPDAVFTAEDFGGTMAGVFNKKGKYSWDQALMDAYEKGLIADKNPDPTELRRLFTGSNRRRYDANPNIIREIDKIENPKANPVDVDASDFDTGDLVYDGKEWRMAKVADGKVALRGATDEIELVGWESVSVKNMPLKPGDEGYEEAIARFRAQGAKKVDDPIDPLVSFWGKVDETATQSESWKGNPMWDFGDGVKISMTNEARDLVTNDYLRYAPASERNAVYIEMIQSSAKGKGSASKALDRVIKMADESGVPLRLQPLRPNKTQGLTTKQLQQWYEKRGFKRIPDTLYWERPAVVKAQVKGGLGRDLFAQAESLRSQGAPEQLFRGAAKSADDLWTPGDSVKMKEINDEIDQLMRYKAGDVGAWGMRFPDPADAASMDVKAAVSALELKAQKIREQMQGLDAKLGSRQHFRELIDEEIPGIEMPTETITKKLTNLSPEKVLAAQKLTDYWNDVHGNVIIPGWESRGVFWEAPVGVRNQMEYAPHYLQGSVAGLKTKLDKGFEIDPDDMRAVREIVEVDTRIKNPSWGRDQVDEFVQSEMAGYDSIFKKGVAGHGEMKSALRRKLPFSMYEIKHSDLVYKAEGDAALVLNRQFKEFSDWAYGYDTTKFSAEKYGKKFTNVSEAVKKGYTQVIYSNPATGENMFEGLWIPKKLDRYLQSAMGGARYLSTDEGVNTVLRVLHGIRQFWSAWTLAPFPAYHARNTVGNMMLMLGSGASPQDIAKSFAGAADLLLPSYLHTGASRGFLDEIKGGIRGAESLDNKALLRMMRRDKIVGVGMRDLDYEDFDAVKRSLGKNGKSVDWPDVIKHVFHPSHKKNTIVKLGYKGGRVNEDMARAALYMNRMRDLAKVGGLTIDEAADDAMRWVNKHLFDYTDLSALEQNIKLLVPFYTFVSRNLPHQISTVLKDPAKALPYIRAVDGAWDTHSELEGQDVPKWLEASGVPLHTFKDKDGETQYALFSPKGWAPIYDIVEFAEAIRGTVGGGGEGSLGRWILGQTNPIIKESIEQAMDKDSFTGRTISEEGARDLFGIPLPAAAAHMVRNIRLVSALDKLNPGGLWTKIGMEGGYIDEFQKSRGKEYNGFVKERPHRLESEEYRRWLQQLTGLAFYDANPLKVLKQEALTQNRNMEIARSRARSAFKKGDLASAEIFQDRSEDALSGVRDALQRMNEIRRERAAQGMD